MDPERWRQIDELLQAALDRDPEERSRFLDAAGSGDPALRAELEALLEADGKSRGVLDASLRLAPGSTEPASQSPREGTALEGESVGPYRLEREIGRGGMGIVFLASRADDAFERRVAVKVLNPGAMSAGLEGSPHRGDPRRPGQARADPGQSPGSRRSGSARPRDRPSVPRTRRPRDRRPAPEPGRHARTGGRPRRGPTSPGGGAGDRREGVRRAPYGHGGWRLQPRLDPGSEGRARRGRAVPRARARHL